MHVSWQYGHGKSSFLIPRFIICQNLVLKVEEKIAETYLGNFSVNTMAIHVGMATFNPKKKSPKYIYMRSSFEDLVARDLMVKTDLQSDFSFKR